MPDVAYTDREAQGSVRVIKWADMANGESGEPLLIPWRADKTVQVFGEFGEGGSVTIQGSNDLMTSDSKTFATLHKADLSALTYTAAGIDVILENCNLIRPTVTAGDETTELTIIICLK